MSDSNTPKEFWIKETYPGTLAWTTEVTVCGPDFWGKERWL